MLESYIIGIGVFVVLAIAWVIVQRLWQKTFYKYASDEDALAARGSCSNCSCMGFCEETGKSIEKEI